MSTFARFLLVAVSLSGLGVLPVAAQTTTYNGNGSTGFNGAVGNSTFTITSDSTRIYFTLNSPTTGSGIGANALAIYIDSKAGGFNSTSGFTDTGDGGRVALSGLNNTAGRTTATFATGFNADYGIALESNFAGLFGLKNGGTFDYINSGLDAGTSTATTLNFSFLRSDLGLSSTDGFTFVASLISTTAYRSNETLGTSVTAPSATNLGTAPNAGFTGTTTFTDFFTYGTPVPEPATWAAGSLTALAGIWLVYRRLRAA